MNKSHAEPCFNHKTTETMKLSKILMIAALGMTVASALQSCKTTEKNYREAYERTMARDSDRTEFESTVYGRYRRQVSDVPMEYGGDTVTARRTMVSVTKDGGGLRENLKKYCVVAGEFKQLFNAQSMRNRLVDNGYPGAFLVQTREPYYYVLAGSFADMKAAMELKAKLTDTPPFKLKAPAPYILLPMGF